MDKNNITFRFRYLSERTDKQRKIVQYHDADNRVAMFVTTKLKDGKPTDKIEVSYAYNGETFYDIEDVAQAIADEKGKTYDFVKLLTEEQNG